MDFFFFNWWHLIFVCNQGVTLWLLKICQNKQNKTYNRLKAKLKSDKPKRALPKKMPSITIKLQYPNILSKLPYIQNFFTSTGSYLSFLTILMFQSRIFMYFVMIHGHWVDYSPQLQVKTESISLMFL